MLSLTLSPTNLVHTMSLIVALAAQENRACHLVVVGTQGALGSIALPICLPALPVSAGFRFGLSHCLRSRREPNLKATTTQHRSCAISRTMVC